MCVLQRSGDGMTTRRVALAAVVLGGVTPIYSICLYIQGCKFRIGSNHSRVSIANDHGITYNPISVSGIG